MHDFTSEMFASVSWFIVLVSVLIVLIHSKLIDISKKAASNVTHIQDYIEDTTTVICTIEKENDLLLLYEAGTNLFLVQGNSLAEIALNLKEVKGIISALVFMHIPNEEFRCYWFDDGDVVVTETVVNYLDM